MCNLPGTPHSSGEKDSSLNQLLNIRLTDAMPTILLRSFVWGTQHVRHFGRVSTCLRNM